MYPPKDLDAVYDLDKQYDFDPEKASDLERLAMGLGPKAEKPWYQRTWEAVNEPMLPQIATKAKEFSEWINPNDPQMGRETYSPRGIASAYAESLGDVLAGLSSPLNVATAGVGTGSTLAAKYGAPALAKMAPSALKYLPGFVKGTAGTEIGLNALMGGHGASEVVRPDATLMERLMGGVELGGSLFGIKSGRSNYRAGSRLASEGWSGFGPKPTEALPANFGPEAYAGPERRTTSRVEEGPEVNASFQEYRDRLARGEDVRSKESKEIFEKKQATENFRNQQAEARGEVSTRTPVDLDAQYDAPEPTIDSDAAETIRLMGLKSDAELGIPKNSWDKASITQMNEEIHDLQTTGKNTYLNDLIEDASRATPDQQTLVNPGKENREFIDRMPDEAIQDFIRRQSANVNYTETETGKNIIAYAQQVLDERAANPPVDISKPLSATNMTPENIADIEAWHRFKKIHDSGRMTEQQMTQWAEIHNRVKNLKPNGSVVIQPYRFESSLSDDIAATPDQIVAQQTADLPGTANETYSPGEIVQHNGQYYEFAGTNPDTGRPTWTPVSPDELDFEGGFKNQSGYEEPVTQVGGGGKQPPRTPPNVPGMSPFGEWPPKRFNPRQGELFPGEGTPKQVPGMSPFTGEPITGQPGNLPLPEGPIATPPNVEGMSPFGAEAGPRPQQQPLFPHEYNATPPQVEGMSPFTGPEASKARVAPGLPFGDPYQMYQLSKMAPKGPVRDGILRQAVDATRALVTSMDMSALRQGLPLIHKKAFRQSIIPMIKSGFSKQFFEQLHRDLAAKPVFQKNIRIGGGKARSLAEVAGLQHVLEEEVYNTAGSALMGKILPPVEMSNRAYNAFLSKLRVDTFQDLVDRSMKAGRDPHTDLVLAKKLADFVNNSTGRGNLGKLEPIAKQLSDYLFAPRFMASKINRYKQVLNPLTYITEDPIIRKEVLKSVLSMGMVGGGLTQAMSYIPGVHVNHDPRSADFQKIRIGNARFDVMGGDQQYIVAASRLYTGESMSSKDTWPGQPGKITDLTSGRYGERTRADVASDFLTSKLAPLPSFVWAWMKGREFDGEPFEVKRALLLRTLPMVSQDLYEIGQEDPSLLPVGGTASFFGLAGSQIYR